MRSAALVLLICLGGIAQQIPPPPPPGVPPPPPPRDVVQRPEPTGTAVIRGRVVTADTGNPIRKANVSLMPALSLVPLAGGRGSGPTTTVAPGSVTVTTSMTVTQGRGVSGGVAPIIGRARQATTDAQGAFEFTGLPAGSYRLTASPGQYAAQYLGMAYGAKRPSGSFMSEPGTPIQLTEGQSFDKAVIALPRGGVITGRVTDENGEPLVRVQVYTLMYQPGSSRGQRTGGGGQTDDLGQFRLFGLQPADYVVAAEARQYSFVGPNGPNAPQSEDDKIGFLTTYYPGTPDEAGAQRVRVAFGAETPGIEIRLVQGRLYRITGSVVDSQGRALPRSNIQLTRRATGMSGMSSYGASSDEQGQFQIQNVPPGNYRLIARDQRANMGPMARGSAPPTQPEAAVVPLTIAGDVENVLLTTSPGITITGHIVFEQGVPAQMPKEIRVMAQPGSPEDMGGLPMPPAALVTPELTFTMKGLMGEYLLRTSFQGIRSITVGADEITDTPREFKPNDRVTITLTSRTSTLEGVVTDGKGPAAQASVLLFSEEKTSWRSNSMRLRRAGTDQNGQFRMTALTPGRYYILAAPRERLNIPPGADITYFEQLAKEATTLVIGDDEQRRIDLKLSDGSGS